MTRVKRVAEKSGETHFALASLPGSEAAFLSIPVEEPWGGDPEIWVYY